MWSFQFWVVKKQTSILSLHLMTFPQQVQHPEEVGQYKIDSMLLCTSWTQNFWKEAVFWHEWKFLKVIFVWRDWFADQYFNVVVRLGGCSSETCYLIGVKFWCSGRVILWFLLHENQHLVTIDKNKRKNN